MSIDPFKSIYEEVDPVKKDINITPGMSKDDSYRQDLMQMRRTDFKILKEVGKGTFGKVYKAQYKKQVYALKEL